MEYIKIEEAASKWGLSIRRVQDLCKMGRVCGAKRFGTNWMVPADALRPVDGRKKGCKETSDTVIPLIRKSPFLDMTDLYSTAGTADAVIDSLAYHPEAQALFSAEIAYSRGQIDQAYAQAKHFLKKTDGFYATISSGMLLGLVAVWKGDVQLWFQAKKHLYDTPWKTEMDRDIISLSIASTDLSIRDTRDFPEWFYRGRFENLPPDAHPAARVYYVKYLLILAQEHAAGRIQLNGVTKLGLLHTLPFIMEPMIAKTIVDQTVMAEIYLRLLCAITYHQIGDETNAVYHLDKAIHLCLADGLYGPLVEHRRQLGLFLDERLLLISPDDAKTVKELHKKLHEGWVAIYNTVMDNNVSAKLSAREREVVRLVAFGLSDEQIANRLHITKSSVKSIIQMARNKTGIKDRNDFGSYI
ncbi:MAG: helix-turn-helix transcriptional regulator [Ruminococcaceae bacterium]|nr:helix-turn-helix transcriptional regulator [Oscillospiraceae bacterium]